MARLAVKSVLVLGSGAIKIGEAGEFDYSGSQALKALREEGIRTILVNPNVATIQTDTRMADKIYFMPVTPEYVEQVISRERPDGIMLGFGGQTALNCGVQLAEKGILERYGVRVLGTPIWGIKVTEDRDLFKKAMLGAGLPVPESGAAYTFDEARKIAREIDYPVIIRVAYSLGGRGGGIARNELELDEVLARGFSISMNHQVLVEKYVGTWKQVEYEVMRDYEENAVTVCNMENVLGMRIHTGDNIVIAPSQTLNNREYHLLRTAAIKAASVCQVVGECNVQFALDTESEKYYVIEINARLSRSSALASKATGYPLAYMAAKIGLGYTLPELVNKVTGLTTACFEPSLDYCVLKMPRWDMQKFEGVPRRIGTQMQSVGEVMAVGRTFEEALQKAVRMVDIGRPGLVNGFGPWLSLTPNGGQELLEEQLVRPTDEILFSIVDALKSGMDVDRVSRLSVVDPWFVRRMKTIVEFESFLAGFRGRGEDLGGETILKAKRMGFSDAQMAGILGLPEERFREIRKSQGVIPSVKQIDTLSAEWPARTNYLYLSYGGEYDDVAADEGRRKVIVLGAGTYRIGSSVEFDWCTVNMVWALKEAGIDDVIVVNCNPETVSTDYDMSDRLYFEELTFERVMDIYEKERPIGIVTSVGGQTANNLAPRLARVGIRILGTDGEDIDRAEDRSKFSRLLDDLGIPQPRWSAFTSIEKAHEFAMNVGYPVLVRPSYVLSGAAMRVIWSDEDLEGFLTRATRVSPEHPVVISKFLHHALETEVDAVADGETVVIGAVIEHIEEAGIHSGDAIMTIPPLRLDRDSVGRITEYAERIARALKIKGPFNVQFLVKDGKVFVIECNLRASRSMPFVSKWLGLNLMKVAAPAILGERIVAPKEPWRGVKWVGVKVPQFSFMQLEGSDPVLGVEMQSTGEVACFGENFFDALCKAMISAGYKIPRPGGGVLVTVGGQEMKQAILPLVSQLQQLGLSIHATEHTADFLTRGGIQDVGVLYKISEPSRKPNISDYLLERKLDLIVNIPGSYTAEKFADMLKDEYAIRRKAIELGVPVLTNPDTAEVFIKGLSWLRSNVPTLTPLARAE